MDKVKIMRGFCPDMHDIPESVSNLKRNFEVYEIEWHIQHFNLATCQKKWLIQSPELIVRGSDTTKWLIMLECGKDQNDVPVFHLQRCNFKTGPISINAEWRLSMFVLDQDFHAVTRFCEFKEGTKYKEALKDFKPLFETLNSAEIDILTIKCFLIVYNGNIGNVFQPSNHNGKNCLSRNLLSLYEKGIGCDLALKIDDKIIMVHKAILCTRIPELNMLLEIDSKCNEKNVINLSLNYEAMLSIVDYAYSGDLMHVLCEPSIAIFDCVQILNIQHLKKYYEPKKLIFRSTLKTHEFQIKWEIANVYENFKAFETPVILDDFPRTWQLLVSTEYDENLNDYISIFLKSAEETKPTSLFLEFAVINEFGVVLFARKLRSYTDNLNKIGFEKFIRRGSLRHLSKDSDNLYLGMKIRLTNDTLCSTIERCDVSVVTIINELNSFDLLSVDMQMLFENSDFSDVLLCFKNLNFVLHRCVLAARCARFATLLDNPKKDFFTISETELNINPDTACFLLLYLYAGILGTENSEILTELRSAALSYKLPVLIEMCDNALKENLECKYIDKA